MTIIGGLTWRVQLVTFEHVPFSPHLLLILVFQLILFHTIVTEGHYMLFFTEEFFKRKGEQSCLTYGVSNDMSKVTLLLVCIMLTQWFWERLVLLFFQEDYRTHQFASKSIFFLEIDVCVYPSLCWLCSLSDILARHDSNTIGWGSRKKSVDYFVCSICRCGIDQALFHELKVFG